MIDTIDLLHCKENINIELKESSNSLPKSIWETYSSFSNTSGGFIYLGIKENTCGPNEIQGITNPSELQKNFFNTINNKSKVNYNNLSDENFNVIDIDGKKIIEISVPECPRLLKPVYLNGNLSDSFKRNNEGDYRCNPNEILSMMEDGKLESFDLSPNSRGYTFLDVDKNTLQEYRNILNAFSPENIYREKTEEEFMKRLGFLVKSNDDYVLTNGAVLLFTNQNLIKSIYPNYFLDYQEKNIDSLYWTYRFTSDDISTSGNLLVFYQKVVRRILSDIPNPFHLDGLQDSSIRKMTYIVREAFANAIINCDFFLEGGIKITKLPERVCFENSGRLKVGLEQALTGGKSLPRNTALMTAFRNLGLCDRGGIGIPKIFTSASELGLLKPLLEESALNEQTILNIYLKNSMGYEYDKLSTEILNALAVYTEGASLADIISKTSYSKTTVSTKINDMISKGLIRTNDKKTVGKKYFLA